MEAAVSDLESVELDALTLAGGWKLLCVAIMHHTLIRLCEERNVFQRSWHQTHVGESNAEEWMEGGVGAVTFDDCCAVLSVSPDVARTKMLAYAETQKRKKPRGVSW